MTHLRHLTAHQGDPTDPFPLRPKLARRTLLPPRGDGRHLWQINAEDVAEARRLFQRAADLDPNFAQAFAALGFTLYLQVLYSYVDSLLEDLEQALRFANKAVALDDKEAMAHNTLGRVQTLRGEYDEAIVELRTAIDLNPSFALAHMWLGQALMLTGQLDEAISEYDTAIRLRTFDPSRVPEPTANPLKRVQDAPAGSNPQQTLQRRGVTAYFSSSNSALASSASW